MSRSESGGAPRKFSEKIALQRQKEAQDTAAFDSIMQDLSAVRCRRTTTTTTTASARGGARASPSRRQPTSPMSPRHASLPNVNQALMLHSSQEQQHHMLSDALPSLLLPNANRGHVALRDGGTGPIRKQHYHNRVDTSPYGSDRQHHVQHQVVKPVMNAVISDSPYLALPNAESSWRRVHSDSALHHHVVNHSSNSVAHGGHNNAFGVIAGPTHGLSSSIGRRVSDSQYSSSSATMLANPTSPVAAASVPAKSSHLSSYLNLPGEREGEMTLKPGSLPDLSNFHVNPSNVNANVDFCNNGLGPKMPWSPNLSTAALPSTLPSSSSSHNATSAPPVVANVRSTQVFFPSEMSNTRTTRNDLLCMPLDETFSNEPVGNTVVRLSDNEISQILSIPMALVVADEHVRNDENNSNTANNGVINEHVSPDMVGSCLPILDAEDNGSYPTNSRHGRVRSSPNGRSASPLSSFSPTSPTSAIVASPVSSPGVVYGDHSHAANNFNNINHNELTKEFQKFSMESPGSTPRQDDFCFYAWEEHVDPQPLSDLVGLLETKSTTLPNSTSTTTPMNCISSSGLPASFPSAIPAPQTPTSIPDIKITGVMDGDDSLHRALASSLGDSLSDDVASFDLGRLDDSTLRLLAEGSNAFDQQLTDPSTEEHLKTV